MTTTAFAMLPFGSSAEQGSTDEYCYYWTDSNSPSPTVSFSWEDITSTGTSCSFYYDNDDYVSYVPIGFSFEFYGNTYTELTISTNGYVEFGGASTGYYNYNIPSTSDPDNVVAPFWDDLMVYYPSYNYGQVYYETQGVAPDRMMVIEYYQVSRSYDSDDMTFEIILHESGDILFQYLLLNYETGDSATVGIENSDGTVGCLYSYNSASISEGLAVLFQRALIGFGPDSSGLADWGTSEVYGLTVTNGQDFTDSFDITVNSTVLGWSVTLYDESYIDLTDNNLNGVPDTGDLAPGESFSMLVYVTVPSEPTAMNETTELLASSFADPAVNETAYLWTSAYQAHLTPFCTTNGYDSDLDGDYDYLQVNISVHAIDGGVLSLSPLYLYTSAWTYMTYSYVSESVPAGDQNMTVFISGETLYTWGFDGQFYVETYLDDHDGNYIDSTWFYTDAYSYTDFDPPAAVLVSPLVDYGLDTDSNGMYDFLVVEVTVEVFDDGYYTVDGWIEDDTLGYDFSYADNSSYLTAGTHVLWLEFPALDVNVSNVDDLCWVYVYLYLDNYTYMDYLNEAVGTYYYGDFEGPGALFAPPYDDYVADSDSDGYYDNLTFEVPVECYEDGVYDIYINVYDYWDNSFSYFRAWGRSLSSGTTAVFYVTLDGFDIWLNGVSGYFYIEMYLYANATSDLLDSDYYESGTYYYYWEFEQMGAYFDYSDDYGSDTDSDGYYNEVVIEVYIDPVSTGYFQLEIYVYDYYYDSFDTIVEDVYMVEGVQYTYVVTLSSADILANDVQGYFYLVMYIYDEDGGYEFDGSDYYTSYYYLDDFDPIGAYFAPPYDEHTVDDDTDGLIDWLVMTVHMNASSDGYYDLEVYVYDPWGNYVDYLYFELYLVEGVTTSVEIEVSSYTVWEQMASGYWQFYAYLYDHYTYVEYDYDYFTTDTYYYYDDFDPPAVAFDPPHYDYAYDVDGDYYYDFLMLEVELDCYTPGEYTVTAELYDPWYDHMTTLTSVETLTLGGNTVDFAFEGWMIWYEGLSGYSFVVDLYVEDSDGDTLDYDQYDTDYYYWYDFESPPAEFSSPHSDYAVDLDGDGFFDYLIVNASVEIFTPGEYIVAGILYDDFGYEVDVAYTTAALDDGVSEVQLYFAAWSMYVAAGEPYYVEMALMDYYENTMDETTYYLGVTYDQLDFDPDIPTIESEWAYASPVIDGTVAPDEWFGAEEYSFLDADPVNLLDASIYVLNNGTHLFILIDAVGDLTATDGDSAAVAFDTLNDGIETIGGEDQFVLEASTAGTYTSHWVYDGSGWDYDCTPFDTELTDHEGLAGMAGFGATPGLTAAHRFYELCIPLALLGISAGDTIGFAGVSDVIPGALDEEEWDYATWPEFYWTAAPELEAYGDLVLSEEPPLTTAALTGDEGLLGWFWSGVEVELSATGGTGGVNATYYALDGGGWEEYTGAFTVSDDGIHTVLFYSDDLGGNDEPVRTVLVMIDTEAPTAEAVANGTLGDSAWFVSAATVTFEADDDTSSFSHIMYSLDGDDWEALDGMTLTVGTDGAHTLEYYAVDISGLEGEAHTIGFMVDMNVPATVAYDIGYAVTLTATDSGSGVSVTMYRIDGGEWITYDGTFEVTGEGNHTVEFYSIDVAGNEEAIQTIVVEGRAGIGIWVWALAGGLAAAVAVGLLLFMLLRRRRGGQQPQQYVPAQGYAVPPTMEPPPPPSQ